MLYSSKKLFILLCLALLLFIIFLKLLTNSPKELSINRIDIISLCWVLYTAILSIFNNHISIEKAMFIGCGIILYFSIKTIDLEGLKSSKLASIFIIGLSCICFIETIITIGQYKNVFPTFNPLFKVTGTFHNPARVSLFLTICLPIFLNYLLFKKKIGLAKLFFVTLNTILIIVTIPILENRTSWIAIFILIMILLNLKYSLLNRISPGKSILTKSLVWLFLGMIALFSVLFFKTSSSISRVAIWEITFKKFLSSSFWGNGVGSFKESFMKWQIEYLSNNPDFANQTVWGVTKGSVLGWVRVPYNEYLEILVEQGVLGILLLVILLIQLLKYRPFLTQENSLRQFSFLIIITTLILSIFSYPLSSYPNYILFFIAIGILSRLSQKDLFQIRIRSPFHRLLPIILITISLLFLRYTINQIKAFEDYKIGQMFYNQGRYKAAIYHYEKAFPYLKHEGVFLTDFGVSLNDAHQFKLAFKILESAKRLDNDPKIYLLCGNILSMESKFPEAEKMYKSACLLNPNMIFPKYILLKHYVKIKNKGKIVETANSILQKSLKVENNLTSMIIDSTRLILKSVGN